MVLYILVQLRETVSAIRTVRDHGTVHVVWWWLVSGRHYLEKRRRLGEKNQGLAGILTNVLLRLSQSGTSE